MTLFIMRFPLLILCFANIAIAKGPPNDHFAEATKLSGDLPIKARGSLTDTHDRFRATREEGEPNHAGQEGHGSVWYSWTPKKNGHVRISLRSLNKDLAMILAVYTGNTIHDLKLVHRYKGLAFPAYSRGTKEPFTDAAYVEFDAVKGRTYRIAIDIENEVFDKFYFQIQRFRNPFSPIMELLEPGSRWEYLLATNMEGEPVDPRELDQDFYHTWMFPKRYDGPKFLKGNMPIGYGQLDFGKLRSNLGGRRNHIPKENKRFTAYLRTQFIPVLDVTTLGIEGVFDDGAILYLNGKEASRFNISPGEDPQDWQTLAIKDDKTKWATNEKNVHRNIIRGLELPADVPVNVSLSLHNSNKNDDDLGTDLRIFALSPDGNPN